MIVDNCIRERNEFAIAAVGAFDARLFADAGPPFICARGRIAGFTSCFALPADWVNISATTKQLAKERYFLIGVEFGWLEFCLH